MATALEFQVLSTHLRSNANKQLPSMLELTPLPIEINADDHRALKKHHSHKDKVKDEVTLIDLMEDAKEDEEEDEVEEGTLTDGMEGAEEEELEEIMDEDDDEDDDEDEDEDEVTVAAALAQEEGTFSVGEGFSVGSKESEAIFSVGDGSGSGDDKNDGVYIGASLGAAALIVLAVIVARRKPKEQLKNEYLINLQDQDDPEMEAINTTNLSKKAVGIKNSTPSFGSTKSAWSIRHSKTSASSSAGKGKASDSIRPSNKQPPASAFQQHGKKNAF
jgi:hypothetical protein